MRTVQEQHHLSHHDQWRLACDLSAPSPAPAEEEEADSRFGKRWYMTVIALLYIGRLGGALIIIYHSTVRVDHLLLPEHHAAAEETRAGAAAAAETGSSV